MPSRSQEGPPLLRRVRASAGWWIPLGVLVASLLGAYALWSSAVRTSERELQSYFDFRVRDAHQRIEQRIQAYEVVLLGTRGLFNGSKSVQRAEFKAYVASLGLQKKFPGIQGVGFSLSVPAAELDAHVAAIRAEGFPDYVVRPPGPRDLYTSIIYLEPFRDRNLRAFGYDMYSEPVRRRALERARDLGVTAISGKVTLVQETNVAPQAGFLMYVPVYRSGEPPPTVEARREAFVGWAYAPFRMNDFMEGVLGEQANDLDLEIYDGDVPSAEARMYDSYDASLAAAPEPLHETHRLDLGGGTWLLAAAARPGLPEHVAQRPTWGVALTGVLAALMLTALTWLLVTSRARALVIADERAKELRQLARTLDERRLELEELNAGLEARIARSVEEIREKDRILIVQGRQAAMGEMIGHIAHQWRQPLNALGLVIANVVDAHRAGELDDATLDPLVHDAKRLIQKMSTTITDFRTFFRPDKEERVFSAREQVSAALELVRASFDAQRIAVHLDMPEDVTLWGVPNEYSQVLLNLLINAKEAIASAGSKGGDIEVHLAKVGDEGCVRIRDTGGGIPPELLDKIFEPYFSTKPSGTGIGLHMCKTIIEKNMGGRITAANVPGGAEITVIAPCKKPG